jgi:hypothetical protein
MNQTISLIYVFVSLICIVFGQSSTTTCSNSNLLMTSTLRQQVLDYLNEVRSTLENGQLLVDDGTYAPKAESLPDLTWDCEIEERVYDWLEDTCVDYSSRASEADNMTLIYSRKDNDNVDTLVTDFLANAPYLNGHYGSSYSPMRSGRHNLYVSQPLWFWNHVIALSDKAQRVGCAIQHCNMPEVNYGPGLAFPAYLSSRIYCQISLSEDLEFGEQLYKVSSSVNYIPPTQDVICQNGNMFIEEREAILEKVNEARSKISQGTYSLPNGNNALQPTEPLSPLLWSCEDESAIMTEKSSNTQCLDPVIDVETEYEKITPATFNDFNPTNYLTWWNQMNSEFFVSNPNFNFLSQSTTYDVEYPAAFALSKAAESIACYRKTCWNGPSPMDGLTFHHICRAKPSIPMNANLYQF